MVRYFQCSNNKKLIIRDNDSDNFDDYILERYDFNKKKWVHDSNLGGIYIGEIPTDVITESEAKKIIEQLK